MLPELLSKKKAVFNHVFVPFAGGKNKQVTFQLSQYRDEPFDGARDDPLTYLAYPVMESFEHNASVAAFLGTNVYWRLLFSQVLDDSVGPFLCVLENSFNQTLTYQLDGVNAVYLGSQDLHDTAFDSYVRVTSTKEYEQRFRGAASRAYTANGLNTDFGVYTLRVYPTKETENKFITHQPWVYAIIVIGVSILTSAIFIAFVYFVERRQRIVMELVVQNAARVAAAERDMNEFLAHGESSFQSSDMPYSNYRQCFSSLLVFKKFAIHSLLPLWRILSLKNPLPTLPPFPTSPRAHLSMPIRRLSLPV